MTDRKDSTHSWWIKPPTSARVTSDGCIYLRWDTFSVLIHGDKSRCSYGPNDGTTTGHDMIGLCNELRTRHNDDTL